MFQFIRREKIYILMLLFILAVNILNTGHGSGDRHVEKPSPSTQSLKEMGITEQKVKDFLESGKMSARFFKYAMVLGIFIFAVSIMLNFGFIFFGKRINFKSPSYKKPVPWGILDLGRVAVIIVFAGYLIGIIEGIVFKKFDLGIAASLQMILSTFLVDMTAVIVVLCFVAVKYRENLRALGLKFTYFFNNILSGITAYIFILPVLFIVLLMSIWVLNIVGYTPPPQPVFDIFIEETRSRVLLFLTLFISIFGPVVEEIFFRGFMYAAVKKHLGIIGAAFLSAAIFSILHTNMVGFLPIMTLGVLLAYLYETTGSLLASIAVHVIHNSIVVGFVFFIKEMIG